MPAETVENKEFRHIVRIGEADLHGAKRLLPSLRNIKGISFSLASAVCTVTGIDGSMRVGDLTNEDIKKLEDAVRNPKKYNIPTWALNRRKDLATGEDKHVVGSDLRFQKDQDIKHLKKIKCYKGIRHSLGLPVRGQRTKNNFRHGKTIGVRKKGVGK